MIAESPRCIRTNVPLRYVPAFSISSLQHNTIVSPLPKSTVKKVRQQQSTFRLLYTQGDLPFNQNYTKSFDTKLNWHVPLNTLDMDHYLPIFFDGLSEEKYPFNMLAQYAIYDLISASGEKIVPIIPRLIIPIRKALSTKNFTVLSATLRIIQHLSKSNKCVGQALVPYYQTILTKLIGFCNLHSHTGDRIQYGCHMTMGELIDETLQVLECTGGPNAYIFIKFMIPTYESCIRNK